MSPPAIRPPSSSACASNCLPACRPAQILEGVVDLPGVHLGEQVFGFLQDVQAQTEALRGKRGLVIGTGLTMNDVAVTLQDHGIENLCVAPGRHPAPGEAGQLPGTPLMKDVLDNGTVQPGPAGVGIATTQDGRALPRGHVAGRPPPLLPVAPSLSKWDMVFPRVRGRDPLNDTVAESMMGLRPIALHVAEELVLSIHGPKAQLPLREQEAEYVYPQDAVKRRRRD